MTNSSQLEVDLAIIGSGFGASMLAIAARQRGRSVALVERGHHPRFAIGESSTPLANLLLEELATRYDWPRMASFSKWGTWQRDFPAVTCGLKRGFSFLSHDFNRDWSPEKQLLVAASPHDHIADTHWYRPDFDFFWVQEAQSAGAIYREGANIEELARDEDGAILRGRDAQGAFEVQATFVVDASGPRGALHRLLGLGEKPLPHLPPMQALFSHFAGVARVARNDQLPAPKGETQVVPYPPDDAALHHLFDGGWMWVLRFNNGLTSAGVSVHDDVAQQWKLEDGEAAWHRLLARLPVVQKQFANATAMEPFRHTRQMSFRSATIIDPDPQPRWALLPSAAGFVDPLLSTGFPQTLMGVLRLAQIFDDCPPQSTLTGVFVKRLREYGAQTERELLAAAELVGTMLRFTGDFETFRTLSLLYFAAASWSETARRLNRPHLASSFLLLDHPHFGPQARDCLQWARCCGKKEDGSFGPELQRRVWQAIAPIDVTGLTNAARHHRYPVDAADLRTATKRLEATPDEIEALLQRSGFLID